MTDRSLPDAGLASPNAAARQAALGRTPPALAQALADPAVLTWREDGVDDSLIGVLTVERHGDRAYLERVVWSFDEEALRWTVDSNELWELPVEIVHVVAARLQADAGSPQTAG